MFRLLCDADWYQDRYPDVGVSGLDPVRHFLRFGLAEGRDPNPFFAGAWYRAHHPEVDAGELHPLLHYLRHGAARGDNPHPGFDAAWYATQHPEAAGNPLLFHLRTGRRHGWPTEPVFDPAAFLPSTGRVPAAPAGLVVDVVIPVYRGLAETRRCLDSVLADPDRPAGRVIVIDDATPERELAAWLDRLADQGRILLLRQARNQGFVAAVNRGMAAAAPHDVVLLNADTEVPAGWLARLAGHAHAGRRIASVSPFSNNATICGYPSLAGGMPAFGLGTAVLDAACRAANAGRSVVVPTSVGFCMYLRRAALDAVGGFDAATFGRGYGEENDFCRRAAAAGWEHRLACDVFVFHAGAVSFGTDTGPIRRAQDLLAARWPDYPGLIARHVARDPADPARFAITTALFRAAGLPVELLVDHGLGGGVGKHIAAVVARAAGHRNFVVLAPHPRGAQLSFPALPDHPPAVLPAAEETALVALLRSAGVGRAQVHHVMGHDADIAALLGRLGVPFEMILHDYYTVCPQVNLLPFGDSRWCGEPGPAVCNACIAARPSHGARDITTWRQRHAALLAGAELVLCPSRDALARLARMAPGARGVLAPHVPAGSPPAPLARRPRAGAPLRILLLGVLAPQKGAAIVTEVVERADPRDFSFRLIGAAERALTGTAARRLAVSGAYDDADLPALVAAARAHVAWFPAQWPETWSYTLSAALDAGLPIVASAIGAFPERLAGRALTWLVDPAAPAEAWLGAFAAARAAFPGRVADAASPIALPAVPAAPAAMRSVVIIPECYGAGEPSPCAHIRLMLPLDHPANGAGLAVSLLPRGTDPALVRAEAMVTHRNAVPTVTAADALIDHCRSTGIRLIYDLDDDLLEVPSTHPEAARLAALAPAVARMLAGADRVTVSTAALARRIGRVRADVVVLENALDERLWGDPWAGRLRRGGVVRVLYMGTATHGADFAMVAPALERLHRAFPGQIAFDMIGVTATGDLPVWVNRVSPPVAAASYPGFVNWIVQQGAWDIGIAPLRRDRFNDAKSAIKAMEYAALGLPVIASAVPAYRGSVADGLGGMLVGNTETEWFGALSRLVRDPVLRARLAAGGRAWLAARGVLGARGAAARTAWGLDGERNDGPAGPACDGPPILRQRSRPHRRKERT